MRAQRVNDNCSSVFWFFVRGSGVCHAPYVISTKAFLLFATLLLAFNVAAQDPINRTYTTQRLTEEPRIDGKLNDVAWKDIPVASNFTQFQPSPGATPKFVTEVKLAYSNTALYVSAMMYDSNPKGISTVMTKRDETGAADYFAVGLDPFHDEQNGLRFVVTPTGVQTDMRILPWCMECNQYDPSWDGVWESATNINAEGWSVEIKIPYSALRFPGKDIQTWGAQFTRYTQRLQEVSTWNPVNPKTNGVANQWGIIEGIANIKPPLRLSLSPYIAAYYERNPVSTNPVAMKENTWLSGGLDLKYGINESFTLDMTLIPDFGQVQSDNIVLNLGPFETQYEERRPFFTEGTELFNKGGLFYSRRVGGTPRLFYDVPYMLNEGEEIVSNPSQVQLLNATKLSGRTAKGLGIGLFNAVAAPAYASVRNTSTGETHDIQTDVLTNYNVLVLNQTLPNNSSVSFTNANTLRRGSARDANASALSFNMRDKKNRFDFNGSGKISHVQDPNNIAPVTGFAYNIGLSKVSGNLTFDLIHSIESKDYDPNDLGILFSNDQMSNFIGIKYSKYDPKWIYRQYTAWWGNPFDHRLSSNTFQTYKPNFGIEMIFKNEWVINWYNEASPFYTRDYYEPRVNGRWYNQVPYVFSSLYLGTDSRKKFSVEGHVAWAESPKYDDPLYEFEIGPYLRISDKWSIWYDVFWNIDKGNFGFIYMTSDDSIFIGRRVIDRVVNTFNTSYNFSPKLSVTLRARHYWTQLTYTKYYFLEQNGDITENGDAAEPGQFDTNFDAVNLDAVLTWQFAPGSFMTLAWKNAVLYSDGNPRYDYFDNARHVWESPKSNQVSLKMIYYLDMVKLRSWMSKP